jgi:hypothetical protein
MKFLILLLVAACAPSHEPKTEFSLPPELQDCKIFIVSDGWKAIYITRCPNSSTSTSWIHSCGKRCTTMETSNVITN